MVNSIESNVGKPIVENRTNVEAVISSLLPSACYVRFDDKTEELPEKFLPKVKGKQNGDKVILILVNGKIDDMQLKD